MPAEYVREEKFLGYSLLAANYIRWIFYLFFWGGINLIGTYFFLSVKELGSVEIALNLSQPVSFNGTGFKIFPKLRAEDLF